MSKGSRIIAIGGESPGEAAMPEAVTSNISVHESHYDDEWSQDDIPPAEPSRSLTIQAWILPLLAICAVAGWTLLFALAQNPAITFPAPAERWTDWITGWSLPVVLIGVVWMIAMRGSRREAARFGVAAQLLSDESAKLEVRLTAVNRELSLAREFIAAQSRDLDSLGRVAVERLSQNADRLQSLIRDNGAQLSSISTVSSAALENMERLRDQLPVIASSAKDVTNNIGNSGRVAQAQLQELISGFKRLNEFGQACDRQVMALRDAIANSLGEFTSQAQQLDTIATNRFAALTENGEAFRSQLDQYESEALEAIRARAAAMAGELAEARGLLDSHEAESLVSLRARLTAVRDESGVIGRSLRDAHDSTLQGWRDHLAQLEVEMSETQAVLQKTDAEANAAARLRMRSLLDEAEAMDASFSGRTSQLSDALAERGSEIDQLEAAALARLSARFSQFDSEMADRESQFAAELAQRTADTDVRHDAAMARLRQVIDTLDSEIEIRVGRQVQHVETLVSHSDATLIRLTQLEEKIAEVAAQGNVAEERLATGLHALANRLATSRDALTGSERQIDTLTDASVRLLELIQAGVKHSRDELPAALTTSEARLASIEGRILVLRDTVDEAGTRSESLSNYVHTANQGLGGARMEIAALHDMIAARTAEHGEALAGLRGELADVDSLSRKLAEHAQAELSIAIVQLETNAREALAGIENLSAATIAEIAGKLSQQSGEAIDRALRARGAEVAGQLEQAAAHASGVSREAAVQLRDQLAKVGELTANLERRVAEARERAEEDVNNDFARRVAMINESLNSNAIDIAKALSTDVSDTAWAAYLRGDRGIFTRRAVNLIDSNEARPIAQLFENDHDFREHVSRYIHDFEAMLRQLLSTRDGHAIGVTLLSSDMGKLYVALAQSIERLRT